MKKTKTILKNFFADKQKIKKNESRNAFNQKLRESIKKIDQ